jgi:ribosomal protein L37AE/L43A
MQSDPLAEWQRLTALYGAMYDGELLDLAADSADLTEVARQVLHDEIRKRGLNVPPEAPAPQWTPSTALSGAEESISEEQESALPHDFTWKTLLCECDDQQQARQICAALLEAGIESWIDRPGSYSPHSQLGLDSSPFAQIDLRNPRVLVAADRLDEARAVIARPIPREIVDRSEAVEPDFQSPVCPGCGASDPVLESNDPSNAWRCDSCGRQWTEPVVNSESAPGENQQS